MLNTSQVFARLKLGDSRVTAVQRIREAVESAKDPLAKANELINAITGVDHKFEDVTFARLVAMACGEDAFKANHQIDDPAIFLDNCVKRVDEMMADPKNAFMFAKPERNVEPVEVKAVVKDLDVKVAVKADGKIKKGGKQILAAELYKKYVLNVKPEDALSNQDFIKLLMKEIDLTKAGATTYAYNCKKQLGEPDGGIKKAKRGKKAKAKTAAKPAKKNSKGKEASKSKKPAKTKKAPKPKLTPFANAGDTPLPEPTAQARTTE